MARKVLQSQFYNFMEDVGNGSDHSNNTEIGIVNLDSFFVSLKGLVSITTPIASLKQAIISVGVQTQPVGVPGYWDESLSAVWNDIFGPYYTSTLEAMFVFGPANKMPLFHMTVSGNVDQNLGRTANEVIHFKKIFRKGCYSGDMLSVYENKRTIEGATVDSVHRGVYKLQIKQVIAPFRW